MRKNNIIHIRTKKCSFIFTLSHVTKHLMTYAHQKIGLAYGSCLTKQNEFFAIFHLKQLSSHTTRAKTKTFGS